MPNRYQQYYKPKRERRKKWIDLYKVLKGCEECGFTGHPAALHFAHKDRREKYTDIKAMLKHSLKKIFIEIRKCRILCANCHAVETAEGRHWIPLGVVNDG